jgi:hypothetical protein
MEHNTTVVAICQCLSVLFVCEQFAQEAWSTAPWQWLFDSISLYLFSSLYVNRMCMKCSSWLQLQFQVQHQKNWFTDGQMCIGIHKEPKGKNTVLFQVLFCFFQLEAAKCSSTCWCKLGGCMYPQAMCIYLVSIRQYLSAFVSIWVVCTCFLLSVHASCQYCQFLNSIHLYVFAE